MMTYETRTTTYEADLETIQFLDNLEISIKEYWKLQGYTEEQMDGIDFRSNIQNSIVGLFRHGGLSPKLLVEYVTLSTSYEATGQLHGEYKQKYNEMTNTMNKRIEKIIKNSLEG